MAEVDRLPSSAAATQPGSGSMRVVIHYCQTCGFGTIAQQIAEEIQGTLGIECRLQRGFWGTLRVEADRREIFNRWKTRGWLGRVGWGRNPTPQEIVALLQSRASTPESTPVLERGA